MEYIIGTLLICFGAFFAYMSSHMISEQKLGKQIPLPWERNNTIFDKSKIKYTDGDNT